MSLRGVGLAMLALSPLYVAMAATNTVQFDPSMLMGLPNQTIDISRFNQSNAINAGIYRLDIYVNKKWRGLVDVVYMDDKDHPDQNAKLCATDELVKKFDLKPTTLKALSTQKDQYGCYHLSHAIKNINTHFDVSSMRLDVSIPQIYLVERPDDYIDPDTWDKGVNSAFASYQFNHYQSTQDSKRHESYLGLNTGVNLNGWYFRHQGWARDNDGKSPHYQALNTYVKTAIPRLQSELTLGDFYSDGTLFEGNAMRGMQIMSDSQMLPASLQGYAPTIHGFANTNATVSIFQNNQEIYSTTVPAGAFSLTNVRDIGSSGDLTVVITESDGRQTRQTLPYHSTISLLRPNRHHYSYAFGRVRHNNTHLYDDQVLQGVWQRGMTNAWTLNTGALYTRHHQSLLLGSAFNTKLGAFSVNAIGTKYTTAHQNTQNGHQLRVQYHRLIPNTKTNIYASIWRYHHYQNLETTLRSYDYHNDYQSTTHADPKYRYQLSVNQPLGNHYGNLYGFFSRTTYNNNHHQDQWQIGYGHKIGALSYSLSMQNLKSGQDDAWDRQYMFSLSMPLGGAGRHHLSSFHTKSQNSSHTQLGLSGAFDKLPHFDYGLNVGYQDPSHKATWSANANYQLPLAKLSATYSHLDDSRQYSLGASGGVVLHQGGITGGNYLGDTFAIVHLPHGKGASLDSVSNVVFNRKGYAILPYITPYRTNTLTINPEGLPYEVQLGETGSQFTPLANASVLVKFDSNVGRMALLNVKLADGTYPPMGAGVYDDDMTAVGFVAQDGRVFLQNAQESGTLTVHFYEKQCQLTYQLPKATPTTPITTTDVICR